MANNLEEQNKPAVEPVTIGSQRGSAKIYLAADTEKLINAKVAEAVDAVIKQIDIDRINRAVKAFEDSLTADPNRTQWDLKNGIVGADYALRDVKNLLNALYKAHGALRTSLNPPVEESAE